jgi:hypothetical protein
MSGKAGFPPASSRQHDRIPAAGPAVALWGARTRVMCSDLQRLNWVSVIMPRWSLVERPARSGSRPAMNFQCASRRPMGGQAAAPRCCRSNVMTQFWHPTGRGTGAREKPCRALASRHDSVRESRAAARAASHGAASRASAAAALPPADRRGIIGHPSHSCAGRKETPL